MNNKIVLLSSLFLASNIAVAQTSLLEAAGKQLVKDKASAVAPGAVENAEAVSGAIDSAKDAKATVEAAPNAVVDQAKEAATQKAQDAVPGEATQAIDTVKSGKAAVEAVPTSPADAVEAVKQKATQKATEKAFDLLK